METWVLKPVTVMVQVMMKKVVRSVVVMVVFFIVAFLWFEVGCFRIYSKRVIKIRYNRGNVHGEYGDFRAIQRASHASLLSIRPLAWISQPQARQTRPYPQKTPDISPRYHILNLLATHVLLLPKRKVERFRDLTAEELSDLFLAVQRVSNVIEDVHKASSLTMAVQDGPEAGQTVQHVHVHIIPRHKGDFDRNDQVYEEIEKERPVRTEDDMAKEAEMLAKYFPEQLPLE